MSGKNLRKSQKEKKCIACNIIFTGHYNAKVCASCAEKDISVCKCGEIKYRQQKCLKCAVIKSHLDYTESNIDEWVECKICNLRGNSIATHIPIVHSITCDEYKKIYSSGVKSKILSNKWAGDKNPGFQHGGKLSPFSDLSEVHSVEQRKDAKEKAIKSNNANINSVSGSTKIENYIALGMTEEEAKIALSERQTTFSLDICIKKYGELEGNIIWAERQNKWQTTLNDNPQEERDRINRAKLSKGSSVSKCELELSDAIRNTGIDINTQFISYTDNKKSFIYDIEFNGKIIEYNGDYWHANPLNYNPEDSINYHNVHKLAEEVWAKDKIKSDHAHTKNYEIMVIWEQDYKKDKQGTIDKCIKFLRP